MSDTKENTRETIETQKHHANEKVEAL